MACDPFRILRITDGTVSDAGIRNEVDLLSEKSGFCLTEWEPAISMLKGGGVWSDSPISDGRRLRFAKAENVREVMTFEIQDWNADALIGDTRVLRQLLEKARAWGTARWQDETVWIEAQGVGETNLRYAIIADYRTPRDGDPYQQPFCQRLALAGMSEFQLVLERRPYWLSNEPGTGTATEISAVEAYDGRSLGNVDSIGTRDPTTADEVYIANKRNEANLSDGWVFDASGPAFVGNLMDSALPYGLYPVPAVGDILYWGIDTTLANSGPFSSLVFDISTAIVQVTTIVWEYWNGAWVALTVQDNTNADGAMTGVAFDTTGVKSVHWEQPSDWATVAVNAITGYWVRARVTAIGGAPTAPIQQNRDVYSIVWPYIEIQESAVLGDVTALMRLLLFNRSDRTASATAPLLWQNRIVVGLRSMSRGTDFTAYLNCSDEQNPTGILVSAGLNTAFVADVESQTGRQARYSPIGAEALASRVSIGLSSAIVNGYYGTYHAFLRARQNGGSAGDMTVQLEILTGTKPLFLSSVESFVNTNDWQVLDLGQLSLPGFNVSISDAASSIAIRLLASSVGAVPTLDFYDLIIIPVDEWAGEFSDDGTEFTSIGATSFVTRTHLDVDSIVLPKLMIRAIARRPDDSISTPYLSITSQPASLQANSRQRLWVFSFRNVSSTDIRSEPSISDSVQIIRQQRYISMRGNG